MEMLTLLVPPSPSEPICVPSHRGILQECPGVGIGEPRPRPNVVHRQEVKQEGRRCQATFAIKTGLSQSISCFIPRMQIMTLDVHRLDYANRFSQGNQVGD
eukprot:4114330-Prorocentrum_lima.AAC.1